MILETGERLKEKTLLQKIFYHLHMPTILWSQDWRNYIRILRSYAGRLWEVYFISVGNEPSSHADMDN